MTDIYKLTEDGKGIIHIPSGEVAPSLKEVVDNLNDYDKQLKECRAKPLDLHKDFTKWDKLITRLDKNSRRLMEIDEIYQECSDNLLAEARKLKEETGTDVIKNKYGANNDKVRRQYVDEQEHITKLLKEKQELEFVKADDNRRISFLKKHIDMKIQLIQYD